MNLSVRKPALAVAKLSIPLLAVSVLFGCASVAPSPVLYPNAKYKQVGEGAAQRDVAECTAIAERAGASSGSSSGAARGGLQGAAMGAAGSAVGSLIRGGNVVESAAAGAAVGGAAGAAGGAFNSGSGGDSMRNFVGRCLSERGYEVMGWK